MSFTGPMAGLTRAKLAEFAREKIRTSRVDNTVNGLKQEYAGQQDMTYGNGHSEYYKDGGTLSDNSMKSNRLYKAMGGELEPMSKESLEVKGRKHSSGGVKLPSMGVELEGGESLHKDFVFSKELGFADKHKPIAKAIGKLEKKPQTSIVKGTLARLKEREESLKSEQEQAKQAMGIDSDLDRMINGGKLKKMFGGGNTPVKVTRAEYDNLGSLKQNPAAYKAGIHDMIGYSPAVNPKGNLALQKQREYDTAVQKTNATYNMNRNLPTPTGNNVLQGTAINNTIAPTTFSNPKLNNFQDVKQSSADAITHFHNDPLDKSSVLQYKKTGGRLYTKMAGGGAAVGSALLNSGDYLDNVNNFFANLQRSKQTIPQEQLVNPIKPDLVNYTNQRNEVDRQVKAFNKGIDLSTSNSAIANSNKASGLASTIRMKNEVNSNESNTNNQLGNQAKYANAQIQGQNNTTTLNNQMRTLLAKDDIRRENSANVANFSSKLATQRYYRDAQKNADMQTKVDLAGADPKTLEYLNKNDPEFFKSLYNKKNGGRLYKRMK